MPSLPPVPYFSEVALLMSAAVSAAGEGRLGDVLEYLSRPGLTRGRLLLPPHTVCDTGPAGTDRQKRLLQRR